MTFINAGLVFTRMYKIPNEYTVVILIKNNSKWRFVKGGSVDVPAPDINFKIYPVPSGEVV